MIILTGGAGFIGSVLLARLNEEGYDDILIVDEKNLSQEQVKNLDGKRYKNFIEKDNFFNYLTTVNKKEVEAVFHLGACTSTTERDIAYLTKNNFNYSQKLADWCFPEHIRFIYASSAATYGDGSQGFSDDNAKIDSYLPLNPYGVSKHQFDQFLVHSDRDKLCVGFKFFNVFGPNEYHKGAMASLVYKAYYQVSETGALKLFRSANPKYKDGEFLRDFIYVKDCVDVLFWAFKNPEVKGIYNLGTGKARSWNDLAKALFSAMAKKENIQYIDMPEEIRNAYQYFTEAEMTKLRAAGYKKVFTELEDAVGDYVKGYLMKENQFL